MKNNKNLPTPPSYLNIGGNIRKWRILRNIEAKEFAKLLKISTGAVSNIENNITNLTVTRVTEIAGLFEISLEKLLIDPLDLLLL